MQDVNEKYGNHRSAEVAMICTKKNGTAGDCRVYYRGVFFEDSDSMMVIYMNTAEEIKDIINMMLIARLKKSGPL